MKLNRISFTLILIAFCVLTIVPPVAAQNNENPANYALYNYYTLVSAKAYVAEQTDTLPQPPAATGTSVGTKIGAASMVSLQIVNTDSMYAVVYVDQQIGTAWTNILQDSVQSATAITSEFSLRSQNAEKTAYLGGKWRVRITFPAWETQGVADATDSPTYTIKWLWKP